MTRLEAFELFEGIRDAFGLRARKAALFQLFDDAVGVEQQCLHNRQCTSCCVLCKERHNPLY